jgi:hypothetical protein
MRRSALILIVSAALLVAGASALAATQTASSGQVTARYSLQSTTDKFGLKHYSHERLQILRGQTVAFDQPVASPHCGSQCNPGAPIASHASSVRALDLTADGEPEVLLDLFTGGAHCCILAQVFAYDAAKATYRKTERDFGDPGYQLKRIGPGGRPQFVSADDNFAYAFTSFAESGLPLQILSFGSGRFTDVTRTHRALVAKDAALWLRLFKHNITHGEGVLAAWAADEELLGHAKLVKRTLAGQLKLGHLRGGTVNGKTFIADLNQLLHRLGYTG